jgi:hypothetical protein
MRAEAGVRAEVEKHSNGKTHIDEATRKDKGNPETSGKLARVDMRVPDLDTPNE